MTQPINNPVLNPAPVEPKGPNTTTQGHAHHPHGHTTSAGPIKTNPSKQAVDPLQVLVDPVGGPNDRATLNQDFPQNRVDKDGKRFVDAEGPTPDTKKP